LIETERLILRNWREEDLEPYCAMMLDEQVSDWLGGPFTRKDIKARVERYRTSLQESGLGLYAVVRRDDGRLLGHCGVMPIPPDLPLIGHEGAWALAQDAWGKGYATEAAQAVFADAFVNFGLEEIIAFTSASNRRSQSVMQRLGMRRDAARDFVHPKLPDGHPLRQHITYALSRP